MKHYFFRITLVCLIVVGIYEIIYRLSGGSDAPGFIKSFGTLLGYLGYPLFYILPKLVDAYICPHGCGYFQRVVLSICIALSISINAMVLYCLYSCFSKSDEDSDSMPE